MRVGRLNKWERYCKKKKKIQRVEVVVPIQIKASRVRDYNGIVGGKIVSYKIQQASPECLAVSQLSHNFNGPEKRPQLCGIT